MIDESRHAARARLKGFLEEVILDADTFFSMIENNPNFRNVRLTGVLDPEDRRLMRYNAQKILTAIETHAYIDPAWFDNLQLAAEHGATDD